MAEEYLIPLSIALTAIAITHTVTILRDYKKQTKELNLVRNLLNRDFARFQELKNNKVKNINNILKKIEKNDFSEIDKIIKNEVKPIEFIIRTITIFNLNFWDAILHSAALLKLTGDEINSIQATERFFRGNRKNSKQYRIHLNQVMTDALKKDISIEEKRIELSEIIKPSFKFLLKNYNDIQTVLDDVFEISWMKKDIEF